MVGLASVAQAGVRFNFGVGIPLSGLTYSAPAPVYTVPPPAIYPAPPLVPPGTVYQAQPPFIYQAPPPVAYPAPPLIYNPNPGLYFSFGAGNAWWGHHPGWGHYHWRR